MDTPTVFIDIYQTPLLKRLLNARVQRWRWRAVNAGNHRVLAVSSESYTNSGDCMDAVDQLFGARSDVWLRLDGHPNQLLRMAIDDT